LCSFFLGKNKVMKLALGRTKEEEYADNLSRLSHDLNGNVGLLFTNRSKDEVIAYFDKHSVTDHPRSGFVATETVSLEAGELPMFIGSMVESLRLLGLPVDLKKGKVVLNQPHTVCKAGQTLTPEQARLLVHFDKKMAEFKLTPLSVWTKDDGAYERLAAASENAATDDDDDDEDM
jgi:mRNA turnover protein 4